ncbi:selenide, water dikinase SelD [Lyngbya confervoides]|uniref:Selenide, water dikinase SelD n=1 Tax=Lyngbya confervoides BDU141951 TaxID=1574623 RepID=A0ABD4SYD6_9CYAN|nr:selenide, water dikinase SelD [Lyngbya confervoides]MCM1981329.1 selenide, water dikinase SelD [Lyngbya confervoides BDU141951]
MQSSTPFTTDLLLLGGGHSHAIALREFAMRPLPGVRITLVNERSLTPYSGMFPGHLAGFYSYEACHIDLRRLMTAVQGQFIVDRAVQVDPQRQQVHCEHHPPLRYDWLSIDTGSIPKLPNIPGADQFGIPIKPWHQFLERWQRWISDLSEQCPDRLSIAIVGGGAGGVETALNIQTQLQQILHASPNLLPRVEIHILHRGMQVLSHHNAWVRHHCEDLLRRRGIQVHPNESVQALHRQELTCASGLRLNFDQLLWVTGAAPPDWLQASGLTTPGYDFIPVDNRLRSLHYSNIFAAGDVATLVQHPRPKAGVFAVRQGKPLAENLRRALAGQRLRPYRPQRNFLSLIGTGQRRAIASWGNWPLGLEAGWLWRWKDYIDRKFMDQFCDLSPQMATGADPLRPRDPSATLPCAGCGSKVASSVLEQVLTTLQPDRHPDILIGLEGEDAAVVKLPPEQAMVQTVDYFRQIVSDPYLFGQISTQHALSDLYAMGATPHSVLAIATLPYSSLPLQEQTLFQILSGCLAVLSEAGAALVGGHTSEGETLAFGLSCTGYLQPGQWMLKRRLAPQQALILTQPLGVGALFAAQMQGLAKGIWIDAALAPMLQSNQTAARIAQCCGATACTDVTGFGLAGHLWEMVQAARVNAALDLSQLPLLPGALAVSQAGVRSSLYPHNLQVQAQIQADLRTKSHPHWPLLFDPQTSGGLLFSVPLAAAADCLQQLHVQGYPAATVIGKTLDRALDLPKIEIRSLPSDLLNLSALKR